MFNEFDFYNEAIFNWNYPQHCETDKGNRKGEIRILCNRVHDDKFGECFEEFLVEKVNSWQLDNQKFLLFPSHC